jgi:hypothetical protein
LSNLFLASGTSDSGITLAWSIMKEFRNRHFNDKQLLYYSHCQYIQQRVNNARTMFNSLKNKEQIQCVPQFDIDIKGLFNGGHSIDYHTIQDHIYTQLKNETQFKQRVIFSAPITPVIKLDASHKVPQRLLIQSSNKSRHDPLKSLFTVWNSAGQVIEQKLCPSLDTNEYRATLLNLKLRCNQTKQVN